MLYGTNMPDFGEIWREHQKEYNGNYSPRTSDDDVERNFWKKFIRNRGMFCRDEYSIKVWDSVSEIIDGRHFDTISEIGPGWGNYTFNLAERCEQLTCYDISPDVLKYIKDEGRDQGFSINTVASKWEDAPLKKSEMIFACNCFYRMQEIEKCLEKIDKAADFHIIGMTSGPEQEYYREFEKSLGLRVKYDRLDYILLVNILYQLGIDVNVKLVDLENRYIFPTMKTVIENETKRIMDKDYDIEKVTRIFRKYFERQEDGSYQYIHKFKAALIYW